MHHPTDRIIHTTAFVAPVVEHWLEREIAQWVRPIKDRSDDPSHHERTLLPRSYISLPDVTKSVSPCVCDNNSYCYFTFDFYSFSLIRESENMEELNINNFNQISIVRQKHQLQNTHILSVLYQITYLIAKK